MGYCGSESCRYLEVPLLGCFWSLLLPILLRGLFCELACDCSDISATQKGNRVLYAMITVQSCLQTYIHVCSTIITMQLHPVWLVNGEVGILI